MHEPYLIAPPTVPHDDLSGPLGQRLLTLLTRQAERDLDWLARECPGQVGAGQGYDALFRGPARYPGHPYLIMHQVGDCALQFAVLACFGADDEVGGHSRAALRAMALGLLRALCATHPVARPPAACNVHWDPFDCLRHDFVLGLAAWLLWDQVEAPTRMLLARMLEHDADSWCSGPAPAQLYDDTQAESNAWSSSGMALAYCLLKHHPRRKVWGEKANELMISAYATEADVRSDRRVDGRPLRQWLTGPNAFPDHTVENHGIIHGDYLAAISEQVRTAILYRLAGEPLPEAVLFNAAPVFDRLMVLGLPDGAHLYVQGSDYIARRLDSFYQACNLVPLLPNPLRSAVFLRALEALEQMQRHGPEVATSGWLGSAFDLGIHWGTIENYLMRRLFGPGAPPLPDNEVDAALAGVHVSEPARYLVHRTATTLSSFSWHTTATASQVLGMTLPLDRDVLVSPVPLGSLLGEVVATPAAASPDRVRAHRVEPGADGVGVTVELERCGGALLQYSAFVSLPDGTSVYLEQRVATRSLTLTSASSGNVALYDDVRGPYQRASRVYHSESGPLVPGTDALTPANWVNVDGRLGFVALGADGLRLRLATDYMHSPYGGQYQLGLLSFVPTTLTAGQAGTRLGVFALVTCPHQSVAATRACAAALAGAGWRVDAAGILAIAVGKRLVWANFGSSPQALPEGRGRVEPGACGWVDLMARAPRQG